MSKILLIAVLVFLIGCCKNQERPIAGDINGDSLICDNEQYRWNNAHWLFKPSDYSPADTNCDGMISDEERIQWNKRAMKKWE